MKGSGSPWKRCRQGLTIKVAQRSNGRPAAVSPRILEHLEQPSRGEIMNTTILAAVTFVYLASFVIFLIAEVARRAAWGRAGKIIALTGFVFHTVGIAMRWVESHQAGIGHAPLSNFYESLVFFSWSVCLLYLIYAWKETKGLIGVFVMPAAFLLMAYASFSPTVDTRIQPLIPALKSNWLIIHVVTCFLGYAAFFMASSFGVISLVKKGARRSAGISG